jgi:hydrogenase nickel incorporation protein HypB
LGVRAHQITTGTVCHLDARMIARALDRLPIDGLDLLIIENVGNLICPASYDLGEHFRVVLASATEGAEKPKKYPVMFNKADVVLLNKSDLAALSEVDLRDLERNVRYLNPSAAVFTLSCKTGDGLNGWLTWLERQLEARQLSTAKG